MKTIKNYVKNTVMMNNEQTPQLTIPRVISHFYYIKNEKNNINT
jgi:hypothetical protein